MKKQLSAVTALAIAAFVLSGCAGSSTPASEGAPADAVSTTQSAREEDSSEAVTFINVIDISEDEIDEFIATWEDRSRFTESAEGFISAELHRAIGPDTEFKVINVSKWESMADFEAATNDPEFKAELEKYQFGDDSTWTAHRGFYETAVKLDFVPAE